MSPRDKSASRDVDTPAIIAAKSDVTAPANTKKVFIKTYGCQMNVSRKRRRKSIQSSAGFASIKRRTNPT